MAHFSAKPPVRVHRINVYGSLTILSFTSELPSCKKILKGVGNV